VGVQKRGGGKVQGGSVLEMLAAGTALPGEGALAAHAEPTPLEQALLNDAYRHYVGELPDHLRDFAELYLAGFTHKEIAARVGCVERTVERKLALVLKRWREIGLEHVGAV
jgi:DNA-directed RNA polymerase specialized sigma24 family protein